MSRAVRAAVAALVVSLSAHVAAANSLRDVAAARGFFVGAAVDSTALAKESKYRTTLGREFNVCVGENAFKFENIHPAPGMYAFGPADSIVTFAETKGMRVRGHTLVWYQQLPAWVRNGSFTRDEAIALLREHITTVVSHFRGKIWAWDVVNEAVADDGSGLRTTSFWYQKIGADYVDLAFQIAHEVDPDAKLYYNDYGAEGDGAKSDAVFELVRGLQQRGVPIDGVGWQMHVRSGFRITDAHRANADRIAALGLRLTVTELDVRVVLPATAEKLAVQAESYRDIIAFCAAHPAFDAVLTWGFTDKHSWIPRFFKGEGAALPFDAKYKRKPAYKAMKTELARALNRRP